MNLKEETDNWIEGYVTQIIRLKNMTNVICPFFAELQKIEEETKDPLLQREDSDDMEKVEEVKTFLESYEKENENPQNLKERQLTKSKKNWWRWRSQLRQIQAVNAFARGRQGGKGYVWEDEAVGLVPRRQLPSEKKERIKNQIERLRHIYNPHEFQYYGLMKDSSLSEEDFENIKYTIEKQCNALKQENSSANTDKIIILSEDQDFVKFKTGLESLYPKVADSIMVPDIQKLCGNYTSKFDTDYKKNKKGIKNFNWELLFSQIEGYFGGRPSTWGSKVYSPTRAVYSPAGLFRNL